MAGRKYRPKTSRPASTQKTAGPKIGQTAKTGRPKFQQWPKKTGRPKFQQWPKKTGQDVRIKINI